MLDPDHGAELFDQCGLSDQIQINLIHWTLVLLLDWLTVALKYLFASHLKRIIYVKNYRPGNSHFS